MNVDADIKMDHDGFQQLCFFVVPECAREWGNKGMGFNLGGSLRGNQCPLNMVDFLRTK